jgi:hypothetical protein
MSGVHHHRDIGSESGRVAAFRQLQSRLYSPYPRSVFLIGQQGHLRTSVSLQLWIFEYSLTDSGLRESAGDATINPVEASTKHSVGYLPR